MRFSSTRPNERNRTSAEQRVTRLIDSKPYSLPKSRWHVTCLPLGWTRLSVREINLAETAIEMGLQENIRNDLVNQLQLREPVSVSPEVSLRETVTTMRNRNIGCAAVVDKEFKPVGIFTESMLTELLSHGPVELEKPVKEYMAKRYPWVRTNDPVAEMLEAMQLKNVRMLCVVDEQDRLVGLTGQRGLMEFVADHFPGQIMVQRVGLAPFPADREGA